MLSLQVFNHKNGTERNRSSKGVSVNSRQLDIQQLAEYTIQTLMPLNPCGFTFNPRTWNCPPFYLNPEIYIVSIDKSKHEKEFERLPTSDELFIWMYERLHYFINSDFYLGYWSVNNKHTFDISVAIQGYSKAIVEAQKHMQSHIYHCATDWSIPTTSVN
ncbi:MAG: hypothetical protein IIA06_10755 [Proteobacteria bacterium]|nr:hypothetical protein [Pseudomonadota bacterium]